MQAAGVDGVQRIARNNVLARQQALAVHNPGHKADHVQVAFRIHSGHLRGLASDQRNSRLNACGAHAAHQRLDNLRISLVEAEVVKKGKRPGSHHHDVSCNSRDQVMPQLFIAPSHHRHLALGADAVSTLHHHRVLHALQRIVQSKERSKRAEPCEHCRRMLLMGFGHMPLDAPHRLVAGLDVHTRGLVIHL